VKKMSVAEKKQHVLSTKKARKILNKKLGIVNSRCKFGNCLFGVVQTAQGFDDHVNTPHQNEVKKQLVVLSQGKFGVSVAAVVPTNTASPVTTTTITDSQLAMSTRSKTANTRQSPSPSMPSRNSPSAKSTPAVRAISDKEFIGGTASVASPSVAQAYSPQVTNQGSPKFLTKRPPSAAMAKKIEEGKLTDQMAVDNIQKKADSLSATKQRSVAGHVPGKKRKSGGDSQTAQQTPKKTRRDRARNSSTVGDSKKNPAKNEVAKDLNDDDGKNRAVSKNKKKKSKKRTHPWMPERMLNRPEKIKMKRKKKNCLCLYTRNWRRTTSTFALLFYEVLHICSPTNQVVYTIYWKSRKYITGLWNT
jgi:hypothetical protein